MEVEDFVWIFPHCWISSHTDTPTFRRTFLHIWSARRRDL